MAQEIIDIGGQPNDGTGDSIRTAFEKTNLNFNEIFNGNFLSSVPIPILADSIKQGTSNQLLVQINENSTGFINAPVTPDTYLKWTGSSFIWDVAVIPSDIRFKENIQNIINPLEKISQIRGVTYQWNEFYINTVGGVKNINDIGVIAQEVETVVPEAVFTHQNGFKYMYYEKLIPLLIESINAQSIQIKNLQEKINILENNLP